MSQMNQKESLALLYFLMQRVGLIVMGEAKGNYWRLSNHNMPKKLVCDKKVNLWTKKPLKAAINLPTR